MERISTDAVERLTLIEKLDEYHQSLYERWYDNHKHPYDEGAMDAVEKVINTVKQHSEWISVDERLPEHDKPVLVWVVSKAGNAYAFKAYYENSWHLVFGEVTHWQPMPKIPNQGE